MAGSSDEAHRRYYQDCAARWSDERYALDQRFVQLTLLLDQGEDAQGPRWQRGSQTFHDLGEVLARVPEPAVVVLGPPGAGKSTLLRHYELDCARQALEGQAGADLNQAPVTFFVSLSDYKPVSANASLPTPLDWLTAQWAAHCQARSLALPGLDILLRQRRLTLLLDALNEIPVVGAEPVQQWKEFLRQLERDFPGNRAVFSCRHLDYSVTLSSQELPVPQVRIEPLSNAQVQEFVTVYCPDHGATLWQNLEGTPQLEVLRSPYYLKLLVVQTTSGEIPAGRAALFTGFVRQALQREVEGDNTLFQPGDLLHARDVQRLVQVHTWPPHELPERGSLIPKLSALAFQMQSQREANEAAQVRNGTYLLPPLIEITGGTYRIGSDEGRYENEAPVYSVALTPFAMAQFPVTNAEWALFRQAGGYEEERWWETEEARAWRRGEGTAEGAKQQWRDHRKSGQDNFDGIRQRHQQGRITSKQADDWEAMVRMSDDEFEAWLAERYFPGRQTQPAYKHDDAFNNPAQPVVGVCWFEVRAYCAWLSAQTGQTSRLPTEAEWEAAARGVPCRRYAFGDDFDAARCNIFETHVRHTTPIGVFPGGQTPEGLVDMTGNTWDWTSSLYIRYPYDAADGREVSSPPGVRRVVRGGSWDDSKVLARASFRLSFAPDLRNNNLGLRVVQSSHILIPLMAQPGGCLRIWLLRACSPAWLARAVLPVLAADYGWRPEAKAIKMAQVSPARTGCAR